MFAQYFLFSPKRCLYKSLFQGTMSFLYSPVTTKELDGWSTEKDSILQKHFQAKLK